jgi:hypothetical protein
VLVPSTFAVALHTFCQIGARAEEATSARQPTRNAGHASLTASSLQPGSALHATARYVAGSGAGAGAGVGAGAGGGGAVTQPAASTAAASHGAKRHARATYGTRIAMGWLLLEMLVALVLAVAIVWWTMGLGAKKRRPRSDDDSR